MHFHSYVYVYVYMPCCNVIIKIIFFQFTTNVKPFLRRSHNIREG